MEGNDFQCHIFYVFVRWGQRVIYNNVRVLIGSLRMHYKVTWGHCDKALERPN